METVSLILRTMLSASTLERLLMSSCRSSFNLQFEGTEETPLGERKIIRVTFNTVADRQAFRLALRRLASRAPAPAEQSEQAARA